MKNTHREAFIMENMGLVVSVTKNFFNRVDNSPYIDREDLVSIGTIGLIKAYEKFDPSRGFQFSTYAVPMIKGELLRFLRDNLDTIKFGRRLKQDFNEIRKANLLNEKPAIIAAILDKPIKNIEEAIDYYHGKYIDSLERPVYEDGGNPIFLGDTIGDEVDFDSNIEVRDFLNQFDERTQQIMKLRVQNLSQTEIGEVVGVSQVEVSRILSKAKKQLIKGGVQMSEKKNRDFNLAKKLAIETDLGPKEIMEQTGVSYSTAYQYIQSYRASEEEVEEFKKKVEESISPVKSYKLSPEELEKYQGTTLKSSEIKKDSIEVKEPSAKVKLPVQVSVIEEPKEIKSVSMPAREGFTEITGNVFGHTSMILEVPVTEAIIQLENIINAMAMLGFKDLKITVQGEKVA